MLLLKNVKFPDSNFVNFPKVGAHSGNPNKIPIGQNERLAKFGTVVESCSKKVVASSVWASVNTFSAANGDFAKAAETFLPLIPTNLQNAKWTLICGNFPLFLTTPHKPE